VIGWTDPEGGRPWLGALLFTYYDPDGRLIYAGHAGTGLGHAELERLWRRLQPLAAPEMPVDVPPPRDALFGSPLTLSRVHWVRPELVAEVKFLSRTEDNLRRQLVYEGLREDKPAAEEVRRAGASGAPVSGRGRFERPRGRAHSAGLGHGTAALSRERGPRADAQLGKAMPMPSARVTGDPLQTVRIGMPAMGVRGCTPTPFLSRPRDRLGTKRDSGSSRLSARDPIVAVMN
jgi:hypothetical protein